MNNQPQNALLDQILAKTYLQSEALRKVDLLKDYLIKKYFTDQSTKDTSPHYNEEQQEWLNSLPKEFYAQFNKDNLYKQCESLIEEIKKITPLVVFLPIQFPPEMIAKFGDKFRQIQGSNCLIEIKIDPSLIAGASFAWKGVIKDYSIRQQISDKRREVLAALKTYSH